MRVSIVFLLVLIPLIFGIPIMVAVYVYRDANKRGMNAVLWTLIALFTPSLLGLIIYLLVRNNYSDLTCPNCNTPVEETYVVCPNCRTKLRPTCDVCSTPVQTTWKVCPHCGNELPQYSMDVATPVRKKDNTLGKILIAILVIPIAILLLLFLFAIPLSRSTGYDSYSTSFTSITAEDYISSLDETEQALFSNLLSAENNFSEDQPFLVMKYEPESKSKDYCCQYLIYIPNAHGYSDFSSDISSGGLFNTRSYLDLNIVCDSYQNEQNVFLFDYDGTQHPKDLVITYDGTKYEAETIIPYEKPLIR